MTTTLKSILLSLVLLPACIAYAQNAETATPDNSAPAAIEPGTVDVVSLPQLHLLQVTHSDAKELGSVSKVIFT